MDSSNNQLFINGCWELSESGQTFVTLDPSTEEAICEVARGTAKDVDPVCYTHLTLPTSPYV